MKKKFAILRGAVILFAGFLGWLQLPLWGFTTNQQPDLIWHHDNGQNAWWFFPPPPDNLKLAASQFITASRDPNWQLAGAGDFDRDGQTDIVWHNRTTGENAIWFMHGTNAAGVLIAPAKDLDWQVGAIADLDGNGRFDIVWRNYGTGENAAWLMDGEKGTNLSEVVFIPSQADRNWRLAVAGDFNGDGKPDLVWSNPKSGGNAIWLMGGPKGVERLGRNELPAFKDRDYRIAAAMDFNGDGQTDLLLHHTTLGMNAVWYMKGTTYLSNAFLTPTLDTGWRIAGDEINPVSWRLQQNSYWGVVDDILSARLTIEPRQSKALLALHKRAEPEEFSSRFTLQRKMEDGSGFATIASGVSADRFVLPSASELGRRSEFRVFPDGLDPEEPKHSARVRRIVVGVNLPPGGGATLANESRGNVVLLVDAKLASRLVPELKLFTQDLVGDGWKVIRHDLNPLHDDARWRRNPVRIAEIKSLLKADYRAGAKSVFIIGHLPIPYAGTDAPDAHADHRGAWPTDGYYGDVVDDSRWTDSATQDKAAFANNHNRPGDGKFDQNLFPSALEMSVGRLDFSALPCLPEQSEVELTRQYLRKNHRYRHKLSAYAPQAIVGGMFTLAIRPSAPVESRDIGIYMNALRNGSRLFGLDPENLIFGDVFNQRMPRLWGFVSGPGYFDRINENLSYDGAEFCHTAASINDPLNEPAIAFYLIRASYMGDWNTTNNFLRATLATRNHGLATLWMGTTEVTWRLEQMALGETLGDALLRTVNEAPRDSNSRARFLSILGDPTLRLHVTAPPANAVRSLDRLTWSAGETDCRYFVYRSATGDINGDFVCLTPGAGVEETTFTDADPPRTSARLYQIRALKLVTSGSGSYTNLSQGVFVP